MWSHKNNNHDWRGATLRAHANAGFTLLELLAAIAILAMVTVMAIPAMGRWAAHYRLVGATNEMVAGLKMAQNQAIIRKREMWFCSKQRHRVGCGYGNKSTHEWLVAIPEWGAGSANYEEEAVRQIDIPSNLEVKDCTLNDERFKVAANGRFYSTYSDDIHIRICAPELAGHNGTREIRVEGGVVRVTQSDASCHRSASCT